MLAKTPLACLLLLGTALAAALPAAPALAQDAAETALAEARGAADAGRSAEAIAPYREAMRQAREERPDWRLELADQLTWAGDLDAAVQEYRAVIASGRGDLMRKAQTGLGRVLARRGDHAPAVAAFDTALALDPADLEAALLRAQALSWDNRQAEAEAGYRALLAKDPADERALLGLARVQTWRGRQRAALATLAQLPDAPANATEAVTITAEAQQWLGRPDRAAATLRARLAEAPGDDRARWLMGRLERDMRSEVRLDARRFDQSDGLNVAQINLGADYRFADGRGRIGPRLQHATFDPTDAPGDTFTVTRIAANGGWRLSNAVDLNATIGVDSIVAPGPGGAEEFLTYDAYASFFAEDRVRIDLGVQRFTLDSEPTLRNRVIANQIKASADVLPTERSRLTARAATADYNDGNRQWWWQAEFEQRLALAPRVHVGARYTGTSFRLVGQPGYFSPGEYHALEATLRIDGQAGPRTWYGLRASAGAERDVGSAERFILSTSAYLRQQLTPAVDIEAAYDYSSSSAASSTGFERGIGRISLIARF
ncbi:tetratricopeptide repeat protein [Erythrobacter sp. W302b]|uniref:tetratricopeptide repeat protein n=1 Tax=Erythrobacter sp. W302b TaxID=3389874 RepID=UPI00396B41A7